MMAALIVKRGDCTRAMVEGVISNVRKDLWVLLNH
jgi:hypothetical protein